MRGRVLVTGGAGSVGRRVVRQLCEEGYAVRVFDLPNMDYTGLEGEKDVQVVRGDITRLASVHQAVEGASAAIHLAALLPPVSERSRELTLSINVGGTVRVMEMLKQTNPEAPLVFSSSVSVYGDTTGAAQPIMVNQPQQALDIYAESKITAERSLRENYVNAVILRISGISVPSIQSPPDIWPFMADQRLEFIHRDDVVRALCAAVKADEAKGRVLNIAGGATWRTIGQAYVKDYYDLLDVPIEEAHFQENPGWCDWYDTEESQRILGYQHISYEAYLSQLRDEIEKMTQN